MAAINATVNSSAVMAYSMVATALSSSKNFWSIGSPLGHSLITPSSRANAPIAVLNRAEIFVAVLEGTLTSGWRQRSAVGSCRIGAGFGMMGHVAQESNSALAAKGSIVCTFIADLQARLAHPSRTSPPTEGSDLLFNHLGCAGEKVLSNGQTECARRSKVDRELEHGRLLHGELGWTRAFEDPVHKGCGPPVHVNDARSVGQQAPRGYKDFVLVHRRGPLLRCQLDDPRSMIDDDGVEGNKQSLPSIALDRGESALNIGSVADCGGRELDHEILRRDLQLIEQTLVVCAFVGEASLHEQDRDAAACWSFPAAHRYSISMVRPST
jgi:hypothetical protein